MVDVAGIDELTANTRDRRAVFDDFCFCLLLREGETQTTAKDLETGANCRHATMAELVVGFGSVRS